MTEYGLYGEKNAKENDVLADDLEFKGPCEALDANKHETTGKNLRRFSSLCPCESFDSNKYDGQIISVVTKQTRQCRPTYNHCPSNVSVEGSCFPASMTGCVIDGVVFLSGVAFGNIKIDIGKVQESEFKLYRSGEPGTDLKLYNGKSIRFRDITFPSKDFSDFGVDGKKTLPLPEVPPEVESDCDLQPGTSLYNRVKRYFVYHLLEAALKNKQFALAKKYAQDGERYLVPPGVSEAACSYFAAVKDTFMLYGRDEEAVEAAYSHDKCKGRVDELEKLGDTLVKKGNKSEARKAYKMGIDLNSEEQTVRRLSEKMKK